MIHRTLSARRSAFVLSILAPALAAQTNSAWEVVGTPAISAGPAVCCQITLDSAGVPYVSYQDLTASGGRATVQRFVNGSWQVLGSPGAASLGTAWYNTLRFDAPGNLYMACRDYAVGGRISIRRWSAGGSAWESVGPGGASPDEAHYTWIDIGPSQVPYVMFEDRGTVPIDRPSVMRFNSAVSNWEFVGPRGISTGSTGYDSIAFDSHGKLYAAFADGNWPDPYVQGRATVMSWDETSGSWSVVGNPGFSAIGALNLTLAFDHQDVPYIAYLAYHQSIFVMKFDGTSWVSVGGAASGTDRPVLDTEGWRQWISLKFDSQNMPYVAYELLDFADLAVVRRFDGTDWLSVGQHGFTPAAADYMAMAIDANDIPYVVFRDISQGARVTVMRYAPSPNFYGRSQTNSQGCSPELATTGVASLSSGQPFLIGASQIVNQKSGMLLWGTAPGKSAFGGGWLLLHGTIHRTSLQGSGGSMGQNDCSGNFSFDFNATLADGATGLVPGAFGFAQYWYRDPLSAEHTGLSGGVRFLVTP